MRQVHRLLAVATLVAVPGTRPAAAQDANASVLESLTVACLREIPDTVRAFRLEAPDTLPYARAALNAVWRADGRQVAATAAADRALPTFRYHFDDVAISYRRAGRRQYERVVSIALDYALLGHDGTLLDDGVCRRETRDIIASSSVSDLEDGIYPETIGARPEAGRLRRYLEPVILTGAIAVGVYLFFSLRSSGGS